MERLIRAIEKKKKESKVVPLLEQLFKCWPDHASPEHAFTLLPCTFSIRPDWYTTDPVPFFGPFDFCILALHFINMHAY